ncbi:hypothetical protein GTY65_19840 [Streptomyces sp. SID8379]|uniref:hypothetical protein n=1 Tax=unclassified Streptomyces TaxID=2593676 RepID=UPI0003604A92|nr:MULTISPECIES: hypothetical protein [unclassified Streptomyces]MYW66287.1 hypothetical protein [Streptomyces sp. SID8379]
MSDIEKAARDAVAAAENSETTRQILAILAAQQLLNAQQQPAQPQPVKQEFNPTKWLVIGGVVVSVGLVASLFAVAIAIGATCATVCLLILRSIWRDLQSKG